MLFVSPKSGGVKTAMVPSGNVSVSTTLVRSTLPVLSTVIMYWMISPAVSTMASSATLARVFSIVKDGFVSTLPNCKPAPMRTSSRGSPTRVISAWPSNATSSWPLVSSIVKDVSVVAMKPSGTVSVTV